MKFIKQRTKHPLQRIQHQKEQQNIKRTNRKQSNTQTHPNENILPKTTNIKWRGILLSSYKVSPNSLVVRALSFKLGGPRFDFLSWRIVRHFRHKRVQWCIPTYFKFKSTLCVSCIGIRVVFNKVYIYYCINTF